MHAEIGKGDYYFITKILAIWFQMKNSQIQIKRPSVCKDTITLKRYNLDSFRHFK